MYGSDQAASIEGRNLKNLGDSIRSVHLILGNGIKTITTEEKKIREKLRIDKK